MNYVVIMAGGSGTRLWPISRKNNPKQFQSLFSDRTLLQETYDRVRKVVPANQIFISSTPKHKEEILRQLPELDETCCILEPSSRNTTAAHGFIAHHLLNLDPDAVFATLPSDHTIQDVDAFVAAIESAFDTVKKYPKHLVTLGVIPSSPETGLGYIKAGKHMDIIGKHKVHKIDSFVEKPDLETAKKYLDDTGYLWNCADYFFRADALLDWIKLYRPDSHETLKKINEAILAKDEYKKIQDLYETIANEQLADSIIEQEGFESLVIPVDLGWSDVGNWGAIQDLLNTEGSNIITKGNHIDHESNNCLVYGGKKLIATFRLKDIIIIDSPDAILITTQKEAQNVKNILSRIDEKYL